MDSAELPATTRRSRSELTTFFYSHAKERVELVLGKKVCELGLNAQVSITCGGELQYRAVGLLSSCEESPRNLLTGRGDYTQTDRIRLAPAATPSDDQSYSGSLDMPGPVLDISTDESAKAAFAVVRNLSTGNYEVYRITAVCSN